MAKGRRRRGAGDSAAVAARPRFAEAAYADAEQADDDGSDLDGRRPRDGDEDDGGDGAGTKMLRNSLFLMASAGLTAGIGFIFWAVVAHLYNSTQIGLATTLLSAISLISFLSTFGFGATMIRFQAEGEARHRQVSVMLALVALASLLIGTGYVLAVKMISPDLAFIRDKPVYALVLIVICVFATVNLVTDSVFMAARQAEYNTLVDGIIQSLAKLAVPMFVVGMGAMGIVAASGTGYVVATLASIYLMYRKLGFRFSFRLGGTRIRETAGYSATTHFSSLLNLIPQLALPIITLRWLGPDDVTYYYLGSQIAALLSTGSYAIGDALFSEGAHDPEQLRSLMKRSAKIMTAVMVPGVAAVILVREPLLSLFGSKYPGHAQGLLTVLALGALAVAFHTWASSALRITGRMKPLLGSNVVYLVATLALALGFAHRGLNWIGWAWALGNLASGLFAVAFVPGAKIAVMGEAAGDEYERGYERYDGLEPDADQARGGQRIPVGAGAGVGAGVGAGAPDSGLRERPRPRQSPWVGVGDSTAITEPMFFPWNRPEARGRSDRFEAYERQGLRAERVERVERVGGLRLRPRSVPRQPGPVAGPAAGAGSGMRPGAGPGMRPGSGMRSWTGPGPGTGRPMAPPPSAEEETQILRPIVVPDSFFRPEPEPEPEKRGPVERGSVERGSVERGPVERGPVVDRTGEGEPDDRWRPPPGR